MLYNRNFVLPLIYCLLQFFPNTTLLSTSSAQHKQKFSFVKSSQKCIFFKDKMHTQIYKPTIYNPKSLTNGSYAILSSSTFCLYYLIV